MQADDATDGLLAEYLLGTLAEDERAELDARLGSTPALRARLEVVKARLDAPPVSAGAGWSRVAAWLEGGQRFAHLVPALARLFELTPAAAQALVDTLDDDDAWEDAPEDGVELLAVEAGPSLAGRDARIARLHPGASHRQAWSNLLVLEGALMDARGVERWRGAEAERVEGDPALTALRGPTCLVALLGPGGGPR